MSRAFSLVAKFYRVLKKAEIGQKKMRRQRLIKSPSTNFTAISLACGM
jgi:hypothetical protein